jgi:hypothetical protein
MDDLHNRLAYNAATGEFRWREGQRHAGKIAGTITTTMQGSKYRLIKVEGKLYYAHRLAWLYVTGAWPKDQIDHINRDGLDNRWVNLREATATQNTVNRVMPRERKGEGVRNVYFNRSKHLHQVRLQINGKREFFGNFKSAEDAAAVARLAQAKLFGGLVPAVLH